MHAGVRAGLRIPDANSCCLDQGAWMIAEVNISSPVLMWKNSFAIKPVEK